MKPSKTEQTRFASPRSIAFAAAGALVLLMAPSAHAEEDKAIGIEVSRSSSGDIGSANPGTGFDLTAAWRSNGGRLTSASELVVGAYDFGGALHPEVYRLMFGGRFGIDWILRPSVFSRIGVAELIIDDPLRASWTNDTPVAGEPDPVVDDLLGAPRLRRTDLVGQLGLALDVHVMDGVDVGIQGSYNWVRLTDSFDWWQAGAQLTFVIGS